MSASLTSEPEYAFICDCDALMRSACEGEIFYAEHNGKRYCVLHFPGGKSKFWDALYRKLDRNDLDFRGVWFPGPWPSEHVHFAGDANFDSANFEGEVDFTGASFSGMLIFQEPPLKVGRISPRSISSQLTSQAQVSTVARSSTFRPLLPLLASPIASSRAGVVLLRRLLRKR